MWVEWQTNRETNLTPKQYSAWGAKHDMKENTSMRTLSLALHLCFTSFHLISKTFITWPGLYHALLAHWGRAWVWVPTRSSFMHGSWDLEVWGNQKCLDKQTCSVVRDVLFGALDNRTLCSFCSCRLGSIVNHEKHLKWNSTKSERNLQRLAVHLLLLTSPDNPLGCPAAWKGPEMPENAGARLGSEWNVLRTTNGHVEGPKLQASPVAAPGKRKNKSGKLLPISQSFHPGCLRDDIGTDWLWLHLAAPCATCCKTWTLRFHFGTVLFSAGEQGLKNLVWRWNCEGQQWRCERFPPPSHAPSRALSIADMAKAVPGKWLGAGDVRVFDSNNFHQRSVF